VKSDPRNQQSLRRLKKKVPSKRLAGKKGSTKKRASPSLPKRGKSGKNSVGKRREKVRKE